MAWAAPVPESARTELARLARRWQQLPADRALARARLVRALAQRYADAVADRHGRPRVALPDLGPAVVIDQLTVTLHDACRDGCAGAAAAELVVLRRAVNAAAGAPAGG